MTTHPPTPVVDDDTNIPISAGLIASLLRCAWDGRVDDGYEAATAALLRLCEEAPSYVEQVLDGIELVSGEYRVFEHLDYLFGVYSWPLRNAEVDANLKASLEHRHAKLAAKLRAEGYPMPRASDDLVHEMECGFCWFGREHSFIRPSERCLELWTGIQKMLEGLDDEVFDTLDLPWCQHLAPESLAGYAEASGREPAEFAAYVHDRACDAAEFIAAWRRSADAPPTRPRVVEYLAGLQ